MKNSNDIIWNRTRDLPTCSAVPQPTAPPRVPSVTLQPFKKNKNNWSYVGHIQLVHRIHLVNQTQNMTPAPHKAGFAVPALVTRNWTMPFRRFPQQISAPVVLAS